MSSEGAVSKEGVSEDGNIDPHKVNLSLNNIINIGRSEYNSSHSSRFSDNKSSKNKQVEGNDKHQVESRTPLLKGSTHNIQSFDKLESLKIASHTPKD